MKRNWKKEVFSIPNILTCCRLLLIPVYTTLYLRAETKADFLLAASILALSCLTDMADGQIARRCHMITTLGKILDPIADKATQATLILCLALRYPILWYLMGLFVLKEGFQLAAGLLTLRTGQMLSGALFAGKLSTACLFTTLTLLVLLPEIPYGYVLAFTVLDGVVLAAAFLAYALAYFKKQADQFQKV